MGYWLGVTNSIHVPAIGKLMTICKWCEEKIVKDENGTWIHPDLDYRVDKQRCAGGEIWSKNYGSEGVRKDGPSVAIPKLSDVTDAEVAKTATALKEMLDAL